MDKEIQQAMDKPHHKCSRISKGHYKYSGFDIISDGYYQPKKRVCWEALERDGISGFAHSCSLRGTKAFTDYKVSKH